MRQRGNEGSMGEENRNPLEGLLEVRREVRRLCPELAPKEERVAYGGRDNERDRRAISGASKV